MKQKPSASIAVIAKRVNILDPSQVSWRVTIQQQWDGELGWKFTTMRSYLSEDLAFQGAKDIIARLGMEQVEILLKA